ncbi:MAG: hypothetical protein ABW221_26465 [Vicinamibacteria bacterium]
MTTLDDAAEALVVKLRALDSEIEESERTIEDLRTRVDGAAAEVERDWTALGVAVSSFLAKLGEESSALGEQVRETLQGVADAHAGVADDGAEALVEVQRGRDQLDGLGQQAASLEPAADTLATEGGEAPPRALTDRARELQAQLEQVANDVRDFLQGEIAEAAEQVGNQVREACEGVHRQLADEMARALQEAYDDWESQVDELEEEIAARSFAASHQHVTDALEYVVEEWEARSTQPVDELQQVAGLLVTQLQELAAGVRASAQTLVAQVGYDLTRELEKTRESAATAVAALDQARQLLASYDFMEA